METTIDYFRYPILYVDDESANRVVMKHNIGKEFTLRIADSAEAALEILSSEFVAVLLADHRMPGMTGVDLAEQTLKRHPEVIRVIITAYSDLEATIDAINRAQVNRFIKKPWTREELAVVMRDSIRAFHNARLLKNLQQRLMKLDRITSVAVMASAIGHDLRQPLAYMEQNVGFLLEDIKLLQELDLSPRHANEKVRGMSEVIADVVVGVEKFKVISETLVKSLRTQNITKNEIDLRHVVESAGALMRTVVIARALFTLEVPEQPVTIVASEGRMLQLMVNLMLNAAQSITPGAKMANRVQVRLTQTGDRARIEVRDTGCGIPAERIDEIFTQFFTTKAGTGSGLGLAICKQVVDEMGGTIAVDSAPDRGSCFAIELPKQARDRAGTGDQPAR